MATTPIHRLNAWDDPVVAMLRGRLFGPYRGFVRDRMDPKEAGRVRVFIPAVQDNDSEECWTDWADPRSSGLVVPKQNAPVIVEFEQGIPSAPLYTPGWTPIPDDDQPDLPAAAKKGVEDPTWLEREVFQAGGSGVPSFPTTVLAADTARTTSPQYPFNKVLETEGGHILEVDDSPGAPRFRYHHPQGLTILVDADGSLHVRGGGAQYFHPGGDFCVALNKGSSFRVTYHGGAGMYVGAEGFHVKAHQATLLGRTVIRIPKDIL